MTNIFPRKLVELPLEKNILSTAYKQALNGLFIGLSGSNIPHSVRFAHSNRQNKLKASEYEWNELPPQVVIAPARLRNWSSAVFWLLLGEVLLTNVWSLLMLGNPPLSFLLNSIYNAHHGSSQMTWWASYWSDAKDRIKTCAHNGMSMFLVVIDVNQFYLAQSISI